MKLKRKMENIGQLTSLVTVTASISYTTKSTKGQIIAMAGPVFDMSMFSTSTPFKSIKSW